MTQEQAPYGDCKHCYWGIPINRKAIMPESTIAVMMAEELESLLSV